MIVRNARQPGNFNSLVATAPDRGLLGEIEDFCARTGMSASRFSRLSTNDCNLIPSLRQGRQPGARTTARIRAFMAGWQG